MNVIFCCFWPDDRPFSYSANQRRRCGGRHGDVRVIGQTTRSRGTGDGKGTNNNNASETPQNAQYTRGVAAQQVNISGYLHTCMLYSRLVENNPQLSVGMGIPIGIPMGVGLGIEIPSPRQPWKSPLHASPPSRKVFCKQSSKLHT